MPTRSQLIADWKRQLAVAETQCRAHGAWLARVRVRLYRFLLTCYGQGDWSADLADDLSSNSQRQANQPGLPQGAHAPRSPALDLDGKPARQAGQIRSVLKSVAAAQDAALPRGPLAAGLDPGGWMIVAAASSKLKIRRCKQLLQRAGLHPRIHYRGDDHMVEVPAHERHQAFAILEEHRPEIKQPPNTPRTERIPLWFRMAIVLIVAMWFTYLTSWAVVALTMIGPAPMSPGQFFYLSPEFNRVWGSLFIVTLLVALLGVLRNRPTAFRKVTIRTNRTK